MLPGWLAAAIACVLGVALAIVAMPPAAPDVVEAVAFEDDATVALARVRETGVAQRPEWRVGEAWRVQFNDGQPVCWMVVADASDLLRQGVACETDEAEEVAVQLAIARMPFVGTFTPDLEGVGDPDEDPTRWFDWPLEDGKRWRTSLFGMDVEVRAVLDDGRFQMRMDDEDGETVALYDYDPALRWWSELRFDGYAFLVHERAESWDGPVALATASSVYGARGTGGAALTTDFSTGEEDDYVVVTSTRSNLGVAYWELAGPGQTRFGGRAPILPLSPLVDSATFSRQFYEAEPGDWTFRQLGADLSYSVDISLAQVETIDL